MTPFHDYLHNDDHPVVLDEMYYKNIMKLYVPGYLPYNDYSPLVPFVKYDGQQRNTMRFFVPNRYNGWNTYFRFMEWNEVLEDREYNANDGSKLLLWGANIRVHCPCPAYLFYGMNYIMTQKDAAIVPETRFPSIRNPNLKGGLCKHLVRTAKVLPFHLGDMARAIKLQREAADKKKMLNGPY